MSWRGAWSLGAPAEVQSAFTSGPLCITWSHCGKKSAPCLLCKVPPGFAIHRIREAPSQRQRQPQRQPQPIATYLGKALRRPQPLLRKALVASPRPDVSVECRPAGKPSTRSAHRQPPASQRSTLLVFKWSDLSDWPSPAVLLPYSRLYSRHSHSTCPLIF